MVNGNMECVSFFPTPPGALSLSLYPRSQPQVPTCREYVGVIQKVLVRVLNVKSLG